MLKPVEITPTMSKATLLACFTVAASMTSDDRLVFLKALNRALRRSTNNPLPIPPVMAAWLIDVYNQIDAYNRYTPDGTKENENPVRPVIKTLIEQDHIAAYDILQFLSRSKEVSHSLLRVYLSEKPAMFDECKDPLLKAFSDCSSDDASVSQNALETLGLILETNALNPFVYEKYMDRRSDKLSSNLSEDDYAHALQKDKTVIMMLIQHHPDIVAPYALNFLNEATSPHISPRDEYAREILIALLKSEKIESEEPVKETSAFLQSSSDFADEKLYLLLVKDLLQENITAVDLRSLALNALELSVNKDKKDSIRNTALLCVETALHKGVLTSSDVAPKCVFTAGRISDDEAFCRLRLAETFIGTLPQQEKSYPLEVTPEEAERLPSSTMFVTLQSAYQVASIPTVGESSTQVAARVVLLALQKGLLTDKTLGKNLSKDAIPLENRYKLLELIADNDRPKIPAYIELAKEALVTSLSEEIQSPTRKAAHSATLVAIDKGFLSPKHLKDVLKSHPASSQLAKEYAEIYLEKILKIPDLDNTDMAPVLENSLKRALRNSGPVGETALRNVTKGIDGKILSIDTVAAIIRSDYPNTNNKTYCVAAQSLVNYLFAFYPESRTNLNLCSVVMDGVRSTHEEVENLAQSSFGLAAEVPPPSRPPRKRRKKGQDDDPAPGKKGV